MKRTIAVPDDVRTFSLFYLWTAMATLAVILTCGGCVTGGARDVTMTRAQDGSWKLHFASNADSKIGHVKVTLPDGVTMSMDNADVNGSNLGQLQLQLLLAQTTMANNLISQALSMVPGFGKAGTVMAPITAQPVVPPTTQPK